MHRQNKKAIVATLAYADIFDFPLTKEEITSSLISFKINSQLQSKQLYEELQNPLFITNKKFFALKGRKELFAKRIKREKISKAKFIFAKKIVKILQYIPTIALVGISGSVAMANATEEADIDLFIIAKKNTLWITRLLCFLVLGFLRVRRKRFSSKAKNSICLNMFMDEKDLSLPITKQNLYTAHEVVQMVPLFIRDNIYEVFLKKNEWTLTYLPNVIAKKFPKTKTSFLVGIMICIFSLLEPVSKKFQLWYMKNRTKEIILENVLAFHPNDLESFVLSEYKKRVKMYGV